MVVMVSVLHPNMGKCDTYSFQGTHHENNEPNPLTFDLIIHKTTTIHWIHMWGPVPSFSALSPSPLSPSILWRNPFSVAIVLFLLGG